MSNTKQVLCPDCGHPREVVVDNLDHGYSWSARRCQGCGAGYLIRALNTRLNGIQVAITRSRTDRDAGEGISEFVRERCVFAAGGRVSASDLYEAYLVWGFDTDFALGSQKALGQAVRAQGEVDVYRSNGRRIFRNVALSE